MSPTKLTKTGKEILKKDPKTTGSLGIAISEAVEDAATHDDTNYALGSVLNHVLLHQTIIGLEMKKQFEVIDEYPDIICGCVGGGKPVFGGKRHGLILRPTEVEWVDKPPVTVEV